VNLVFRFRVHCGCRFVEDYNLRVLQERARNRQALTLAAGNFEAALADDRTESIGQAFDKFSQAGHLDRPQ
jgi:hypothetical protein